MTEREGSGRGAGGGREGGGRAGRGDFRAFWTRRARRLLPAFAAMLVAVVLWAASIAACDGAAAGADGPPCLSATGYDAAASRRRGWVHDGCP